MAPTSWYSGYTKPQVWRGYDYFSAKGTCVGERKGYATSDVKVLSDKYYVDASEQARQTSLGHPEIAKTRVPAHGAVVPA